MRNRRSKINIDKTIFLTVGSAFITFIIIARLFQLQVIANEHYQNIATREQYGLVELPAQRGEIMIKDYHSNEEFLLATNTTLNLLYADPSLIKDPDYISAKISPLLFNIENERAADNERIEKLSRKIPATATEEEKEEMLKPLTDTELEKQFKKNISEKIGAKRRQEILLGTYENEEKLKQLSNLGVTGIEVIENKVYAYPPQIANPKSVAEKIADYVEIPSTKLATILKGENRYVILQRKLSFQTTEAIQKLMKEDKDEMFKGLGFQEEYFRFYPEKTLAANIIGYVNHANIGQYGIESTFNKELEGVAGKLQTKRDSIGRQITVGESYLEKAIDGDDIVLTTDRSIQLKVETILESAVKEYQADSGQIIIMNPQTGSITAMAHYPSYDPNEYGKVFKKVEVKFNEEEIKSLYPTKQPDIYYFYKNAITLDKYMVFAEKDENDNVHYFRYENYYGPEVYHNKIVSWPYEPGSVFKSIVMAIGIDDGDITPNTTFNDVGPIGVDKNVYTGEFDFEIKNSEGYYGLINMTTVLGKSLNTGMTFIAKKIGAALFYNYLEKFGFLDRTDIEFETEVAGKIEYFDNWTESELATHAFGQGLTVTMIQLANAYSAIANGGILMRPYIVDEVRHDDKTVTKTEPHEIRRVISEDTSDKMIAMLTSSTEVGVANRAQVPGHLVAGKTGTSQTYKNGKALSGKGTTIATFAGFGPVNDPKFVVLVKFDHPKASEWGSATAAPTFSKIAEYLFDYYNIPPDK
ncbi:hypothetical protein COU74_00735 [Candidatus Peregrinibacteria bacterium CG10_big_fil_rev_8_21_14_0_10_36_19]|nr:MAG: hypothetical protein COU74_00735 [Candidatus Peregrinibacteria bacterium CG10_big_fil_rev_8_21_14_0_10_36_19]